MTKKAVFLLIAFFLFVSLVPSSFAAPKEEKTVPEKNGVYDDPDHPGVKVRVFVHHERPQKAENPALVCSLSDPESASPVGPTGWKLSGTITYNLNVGSVPSSVGGGNLPTIVQNAFSDWTSASGNKVSMVRGANTTVAKSSYDGRNVIAWGRTSGSALGVTYTRYYPSTGQVVDVDTIMNVKFPWRWANSNTCSYT